MNIKIDEINKRAVIELNGRDFFLIKTGDEEFPYGLAYRIDMSYAGKADQWSQPVILLGEDEAAKLRLIFDEIL